MKIQTHTYRNHKERSHRRFRLKKGIPPVLLALLLLPVLVMDLPGQARATVTSSSGRVEFRSEGQDWRPVQDGQQLNLGDTISTGFGSEATLQIGNAVVEARPLTRMRLDRLIEEAGIARSEVYLEVGRIRAEVQAQEGIQQEFQLRSPVSTAAVRGTLFEFDGVNIEVQQGMVMIQTNSGIGVRVGSGEASSTDGFSPPAEGATAREQLVAIIPYVPGAEERVDIPTRPADPTTGSLKVSWEVTQIHEESNE
jgi:hypothetical protein